MDIMRGAKFRNDMDEKKILLATVPTVLKFSGLLYMYHMLIAEKFK